MNVLYFMVPVSLMLGLGFLVLFLIAAKKGQFDDLVTPAHRILENDNQTDNKERT